MDTMSMNKNLVCLVKGHIVCVCSCHGYTNCCGCGFPKNGKNNSYHCIECGEDYSEEAETRYGSREEAWNRKFSARSKDVAAARNEARKTKKWLKK